MKRVSFYAYVNGDYSFTNVVEQTPHSACLFFSTYELFLSLLSKRGTKLIEWFNYTNVALGSLTLSWLKPIPSEAVDQSG